MNSLRKGGMREDVDGDMDVGDEVENLWELLFLKREEGLRIEGRGKGEGFRKVRRRDMVFGGGRGAFWRRGKAEVRVGGKCTEWWFLSLVHGWGGLWRACALIDLLGIYRGYLI